MPDDPAGNRPSDPRKMCSMTDRAEPLTRDRNRMRYRYVNSRQGKSFSYHAVAEGSFWTLCDCGRSMKFHTFRKALRRNSRRHYKWAQN